MKKIIKLFAMIIVFVAVLLLTNQVKAGSIKLNNLDFQIQLNEDGSMDVTENWDAKITNTNTMFKDFTLDSSKYKEITDVEVYMINSDGTSEKLTQIYEEMYYVTKNCYYGLKIDSETFEIAWGVSVKETETRKYQIKYKVVDAVKTYKDCSELYWQLLSTDNEIAVTKFTATIYLPKTVTDKNNVRGWAHGPYNGNISVYADRVNLEVDYLDAETMVEARVVTLENLFTANTVTSKSKFKSILSEEQKWAKKSNEERQEYITGKDKKSYNIVFIFWIMVNVIAGIVFATWLLKSIKKLRSIKEINELEVEYFRDIPDKEASAAEAAFLYYFKTYGLGPNMSKILSATMLQLALKKYIIFIKDNIENRQDIKIRVIEGTEKLTEDEKIVYQMLKEVSTNLEFSIKEFEEYAIKDGNTFISRIISMEKKAEEQQIEKGNYRKDTEKSAKQCEELAINYFVFGIMFIVFFPLPGIIMLISGVINLMLRDKIYNLTEKGITEQAKWIGLKKYMEDFSLLNEKEVPDLKLWEKYLVYATAFGIADKVLRQLKIKYPQLQNMNGHDYSYMHIIYDNSINNSMFRTINTSVNKAYNSSTKTNLKNSLSSMGGMSDSAYRDYDGGNYSSGEGFGGGFSSGGGGRRRQRSYGWQIII